MKSNKPYYTTILFCHTKKERRKERRIKLYYFTLLK